MAVTKKATKTTSKKKAVVKKPTLAGPVGKQQMVKNIYVTPARILTKSIPVTIAEP